jgi:hypothetical protein
MWVWLAGVTEILTRHLPKTTLGHYCYTSLLSTVDKNEVYFHHNRGKYTMIKGYYRLKLGQSVRKIFCGHNLTIIIENPPLSANQTSLKGLS